MLPPWSLPVLDGENMKLGGSGRSRSPSSTFTVNPKLGA